jgi:putative ABC transport system permease protein
MLRAAIRVIRADLAARPLHAVLTGLVIAIAAGTLLVTLYMRASLDAPYDGLRRATNAADAFAVGQHDDVTRLAHMPGVRSADPPRALLEAPLRYGRDVDGITLIDSPAGARLDRPRLVAGRAARAPGEVMVDHVTADLRRIRLGSTLPIGSGARRLPLRVVGIGAWTHPGPFGWLTRGGVAAAERRIGGRPQYALAVRLRDPNASVAFAERAAESLRTRNLRVSEWQQTRNEFSDDSRRMLTIISATTVLGLIGAAFTLATAIGGRVIAQRRQIGLLRAVGITPSQATALMVAHYVGLALIAAPVGLVGGALIGPRLVGDTARMLAMPAPGIPDPGQWLLALAATLAVVTLATAVPARRAGRITPAETLALGRGARSARASRLARWARALHLPVIVGLGAKDAFAHRGRAALTLGSLALAAAVLVCTMGFEATTNRVGSDEALRAQPWDLGVSTTSLSPERVDALLRARPEVAAVARVYYVGSVGRGGLDVELRVIDGPLREFPFAIRDGHAALAPGEATFGRAALEHLGVGIGGRTTLTVARRPVTLRAVGRHIEPDNDGVEAVLPIAGLPAAVRATLRSPDWAVRLRPGTDARAVQRALAADTQTRLSVWRPIESLQQETAKLRPVVYGVTGLLLAVALVNLLTTLLLTIAERERDVAVLGAVGATPRQVTAALVSGGALLALVGGAIGVPVGAWLFRFLISQTDPSDGPDVVTLPAWWWFPLVLPVGLLLCALVSGLAARRATHIRPAAALRAE